MSLFLCLCSMWIWPLFSVFQSTCCLCLQVQSELGECPFIYRFWSNRLMLQTIRAGTQPGSTRIVSMEMLPEKANQRVKKNRQPLAFPSAHQAWYWSTYCAVGWVISKATKFCLLYVDLTHSQSVIFTRWKRTSFRCIKKIKLQFILIFAHLSTFLPEL